MPAPKPEHRLRLLGLGELSPGEHRFSLARIAVGSGADSDFVIAHATVSRKHAMLRDEGRGYLLEDLASTNGTFVNGKRIRKPTRIEPGDEIGFGSARFAVAWTDIGAPTIRRRPLARRSLAAVGIILCGIAGFMIAHYVVEVRRLGKSAMTPTPAREAVHTVPSGEVEETPVEESSTPVAPENPGAEALWLTQLNWFRVAAGLPAVEDDAALSDGDRKHAIYLLKNFASEIRAGTLGAESHSEDPSNQWFTPEGAEAARANNVTERFSHGPISLSEEWAIDGWMATPFHRFPMLNPMLQKAGFGSECENEICVAVLSFGHGVSSEPGAVAPPDRPIIFPPDGGSIPSDGRTIEGEWPDPLTACEGYAYPTGAAMTLELGPTEAQLDSFTVTDEAGRALEACGFDANSYRNPDETQRSIVVGNLRARGAVVIVPRHPLDAGAHYDVMATVNGRDYKWSFSVAR